MKLKTFAFILAAFILVAVSSTFAAASVNYGEPHSGIECVGCYYQYSQSFQYARQDVYFTEPVFEQHYYDYIAPARAGGWFGTGTEWLINLRSPMYTQVPPVRFTNYHVPTCGWPCWTGGNGYPRPTASAYPRYRMPSNYGGFNY